MTPEALPELVRRIKAHWPTWAPTLDQLEVSAPIALDGLDLATCIAAVDAIALEGAAFAPTFGQVRAKAASGLCSVEQALAEIQAAVRTHGYTAAPSFSQPFIDAAVAAYGGWNDVCCTPNPNFLPQMRGLLGEARERATRGTLPSSVRAALGAGGAYGLDLSLPREPRALPHGHDDDDWPV